MSFLNSILSSIGNANAAPPPNTQSSATKPTPSGVPQDSTRSTAPNPAPPLKRKAEDVSSTGPPAKSARTNTPAVPMPPKPQPATQLPIRPLPKSNPSTTSIKSVSTSTTTARPSTRPPITTRQSDTTPGTVKPKAKSSYQAILQRAAAAKATVTEQGQIKHKAVSVAPKLSRQQRLAQEEETQRKVKLEARAGKSGLAGRDQRPSGTKPAGSASTDRRNASPAQAAKPARPREDLGYKGTMRPAVPEAGTRRPNPTPSGSSRTASWVDRSVPGRPPDADDDPEEKRYTYRSETEDEYDDDDESDDNERPATYADIEEEEAEAERQARKEDARELARENAHRTEKMKRREALERMQAARKKG